MSDSNEGLQDLHALLGAAFLADGEELVWLAGAAPATEEVPTDFIAAAPVTPDFVLPEYPEDPTPEPAMQEQFSLEDDDGLKSYLDAAANLATAAGNPLVPAVATEISGNGIFVPYEPPPAFVGLEAVGVLPPT